MISKVGLQAHEKMLNTANYQRNANQNTRYHLTLVMPQSLRWSKPELEHEKPALGSLGSALLRLD